MLIIYDLQQPHRQQEPLGAGSQHETQRGQATAVSTKTVQMKIKHQELASFIQRHIINTLLYHYCNIASIVINKIISILKLKRKKINK